jgi:carboxymethylenebutenolidase
MRKVLPCFLFAVLALSTLAVAQTDDDYIARMEREHRDDTPVASPAADTQPAVDVVTEDVVYAELDGKKITGFLARPKNSKGLPGLIVIHEWWGVNDNVRAMAERFAAEGYVALAGDLYGGEVGEDREGAARLARAAGDQPLRVEENLRQAWRHLEQELSVPRIGVVGWCFGGGWSLRTALALGDGIDATVIYYGRLVTDPAELEPLASPVLGIFGSLDQGIPVETVREFESALDSLGKKAAIHVYEDADHAFANPSGTRYNAEAAEDAWEKTMAFFAQNLRRSD